jgi:hypothetical protein
MAQSKDPVVFLLPNGTEVSNDPRYYQEKMRQQIINQNQARVMDASGENTGTSVDDDDSIDMDEDAKPLEEMSSAELKAEVARLKAEGVEVDTSGVKNKKTLVERIQAATADDGSSDDDADDES